MGVPLISHLLYADDFLIFANGQEKSMQGLIDTLPKYEKWLGQKIGKEKSAIFPSNRINSSQILELLRTTSFKEGKFSVTYLGMPFVFGRLLLRTMEPLIEKIKKNVASWKGRLLSEDAQMLLLRHTLYLVCRFISNR